MIEDDIYRTSTQYRYWSYTPQRLADLRRQTNELASEKVRAAFRRAQRARNGNAAGDGDAEGDDGAEEIEVTTLTVEEELKIVEWGCGKIVEMGEAIRPRVPGAVVATAIQYLRRFHLSNSPMTYHPRSIILCCLFLACKADHFYLSLRRFIEGVDPDGSSGVSEEDVKAPEFLLLQGLRFTLEVRHPLRGLQGGVVDMGRLIKQGHLRMEGGEGRVGKVAEKVKGVLKREAQMTDVYFLWTTSQIWLAAVFLIDEELARAYLEVKFEELGDQVEAIREKLVVEVEACAQMLRNYKSPDDDKAGRREMNRIGRKLIACQNPEKMDIVAVARAKAVEKREGGNNSEVDMKKKKRKLERERAERDGDVFGGDLKNIG